MKSFENNVILLNIYVYCYRMQSGTIRSICQLFTFSNQFDILLHCCFLAPLKLVTPKTSPRYIPVLPLKAGLYHCSSVPHANEHTVHSSAVISCPPRHRPSRRAIGNDIPANQRALLDYKHRNKSCCGFKREEIKGFNSARMTSVNAV